MSIASPEFPNSNSRFVIGALVAALALAGLPAFRGASRRYRRWPGENPNQYWIEHIARLEEQ